MSLVCLLAATATGQVPAEPSGKLAEGWRREVKVSDEGDVVIAWVEKSWLQVQRRNAAGDLDWHIVLAKATDPQPPTIDTWNLAGSVYVNYRNGSYFIREYTYCMNCHHLFIACTSSARVEISVGISVASWNVNVTPYELRPSLVVHSRTVSVTLDCT